ncbi:hypothetical protein CATRI_09060 [Corynebacterium atrinae]|uniref:DUF2786 domain-containing protein n=1 Tax=Corynebacterium atrinae TaxID=1336740 RepID=UPI0025B542BE|nr:DUF2786 domain-containing protein [Corynebacterium atrinae]WJY63884.1 hypothetical protein CATRI_09060 [Corynebacterium atrinae]
MPNFSDDVKHKLQAEAASELVYRRQLKGEISDLLMISASRGWTPDDLRHVSGTNIDPLLLEAQNRIHGCTTPAIRAAWQRHCLTTQDVTLPIPELEMIKARLGAVPRLRDADIVTDVSCLGLLRDVACQGAQGTTTKPSADGRPSTAEARIRQRIALLLKKAESTNYEAEAESFIAKAQQLRQRYRLDSATEDDSTFADSQLVSVRIRLTGTWVRYQYLLLCNVARPNSCESILIPSVDIASVVGHPEDVWHVVELFAELNRQRDFFMRTSPGAREAAQLRQTAPYRRSFLLAFATRIGTLLAAANKEVPEPQPSDSMALALLVRRGQAASDFMESVFGSARSMTFSPTHRRGFEDGFNAATNSHFSAKSPTTAQRAG